MFNHILVPIDGTKESEKAIGIACDLAKNYGSTLEFVYVVTDKRISQEEMNLVENEHLAEIERSVSDRIDRETLGGAMALPGLLAEAGETTLRVRSLIGEKLVSSAKAEAERAGITVVGAHIETGEPTETILKVAEEKRTDAIVMGSRGRGDFKGLVLGSVSHDVAAHAKCTVISVK